MNNYIFTKNNYEKYLNKAMDNDSTSQLIISCYYVNTIFP